MFFKTISVALSRRENMQQWFKGALVETKTVSPLRNMRKEILDRNMGLPAYLCACVYVPKVSFFYVELASI